MFAVRTDESDAAERVTETALDIAEKYTVDVRTVHVAGSTTYDLEDAPRSIIGLLDWGSRNATEAIASMARVRELDVRTDVHPGVPVRSVGSGPLLGSTTARVVRRSTVSVLIVTWVGCSVSSRRYSSSGSKAGGSP